jgi:hypothetical protein
MRWMGPLPDPPPPSHIPLWMSNISVGTKGTLLGGAFSVTRSGLCQGDANVLHKCHTPSRIGPEGVTQMSPFVTHWAHRRYTNVTPHHALGPKALHKCHTPSRIGPAGVTQMCHSVTHWARRRYTNVTLRHALGPKALHK